MFLIKSDPVNGVIQYFQEVRSELGKVIWPKREEVIRLTLIVLIVSGLVAAYVGGVDYVLTKLLEVVLTL